MMKILVMLGDGFEDIEGLTVIDVARIAGIETIMVSVSSDFVVTSARGIRVITDKLIDDVIIQPEDMIVLPGGLKGVGNLEANDKLKDLLIQHRKHQGLMAAICAAPLIPGKLGLLKGVKACCYPGIEQYLDGAQVLFDDFVVDQGCITARGAGLSLVFALAIVETVKGREEADKIRSAMLCK